MDGCVDIKCNNPVYDYNVIEYCGLNTVCNNTPGWIDMPYMYNCSCSQGYELFMEYRGKIGIAFQTTIVIHCVLPSCLKLGIIDIIILTFELSQFVFTSRVR
jgi:hypothetical protein